MSDEANAALINSYKERFTSLEAENKKLAAESSKRRHKNRELQEQIDRITAERDEIAQGFETLEQQHKDLEARSSAAPEEKDRRIAELEHAIRTRDHKETFKKVAKAANVREDALDDLWDLSGYQAEGDQADEAKLSELVAAKLKGRDYLLAPKVETTTAAPDGAPPTNAPQPPQGRIETPAAKPGPGATRTTSDTTPPAAQGVLDRVNRDFSKFSITGNEGRL